MHTDFVIHARESIEALIFDLAEQELGGEALPDLRSSERMSKIIDTYCNPILEMPTSIQTDDSLDWYLDSVEYHLAQSSLISSYLRWDDPTFMNIQAQMAKAAKDTFSLMATDGLTREQVEEIRNAIPGYCDQVADIIVVQLHSAKNVYISKDVRTKQKRLGSFLETIADEFIEEDPPDAPWPPDEEGVRRRKNRIVKILAGLYVEEQVRDEGRLLANAVSSDLQSLFNASWYFGDQVPQAPIMDSETKSKLMNIFKDELGTNVITFERADLSYQLTGLFNLALSVPLGPEILSSIAHSSGGWKPQSIETHPESYIEMIFPYNKKTVAASVRIELNDIQEKSVDDGSRNGVEDVPEGGKR